MNWIELNGSAMLYDIRFKCVMNTLDEFSIFVFFLTASGFVSCNKIKWIYYNIIYNIENLLGLYNQIDSYCCSNDTQNNDGYVLNRNDRNGSVHWNHRKTFTPLERPKENNLHQTDHGVIIIEMADDLNSLMAFRLDMDPFF